MNFMDVFLDPENLLLNFDKDEKSVKSVKPDVSTTRAYLEKVSVCAF